MKILSLCSVFLIYLLIGFSHQILAQPCATGSASETLDAANSNIKLSSTSLWPIYLGDSRFPYVWPKTENPTSNSPGIIFAGNLWIGGFDDGGNLKLSAETYGQAIDKIGYWPGPLNADTLLSDAEICNNWDRLFKVNKFEIEDFRADYADNQQFDNPIPLSILGWPGRGNPSFNEVYGFDLPSNEPELAPFFDGNSNGIYEPMIGEYPLIKCADQAVWWVFNDASNINFYGANPIEIEIQILAYVYNSSDVNVYNSSFYDVKMINRGVEPLDSAYVGLWIDMDLGCAEDDFIGCAPEENLAYVYNSDPEDGYPNGSCGNGIGSYQDEPPIYGIKLLKGPLDKFGNELNMSSFNFHGPSGTFPSTSTVPNSPIEFYNILTGRKADGTVYLNPDGEPTNFLYPNNPSNADGWSLCSEEFSPADRRFVMSMGPMRFMPGASNEMTFAVVVQAQPEMPCPDVNELIAAADLPAPSNEPGNFYCDLTVNTLEINLQDNKIAVYPNPASDLINFQLSESEFFVSLRVFRIDGELVRKLENIRSSSAVLSRNDLPSGTYIYQAQTEKGASLSGKIILE